MQSEPPQEPSDHAGAAEQAPFWTLANLAFVALMAFAFAVLIAGLLLDPKAGLVHPEL